jgi:predicted secreted protein
MKISMKRVSLFDAQKQQQYLAKLFIWKAIIRSKILFVHFAQISGQFDITDFLSTGSAAVK